MAGGASPRTGSWCAHGLCARTLATLSAVSLSCRAGVGAPDPSVTRFRAPAQEQALSGASSRQRTVSARFGGGIACIDETVATDDELRALEEKLGEAWFNDDIVPASMQCDSSGAEPPALLTSPPLWE